MTEGNEGSMLGSAHSCPACGTPLGYEGLCWRCRAEREREDARRWSPGTVAEKQRSIAENIEAVGDFREPEFSDFWKLLGYHNAITPDMQRAALDRGMFYPSEIYYRAPDDVRDGLISALMGTEDPQEANQLMMCLAMQGDDRALEALLELENNPRPWMSSLFVGPSVYAQCGGWTFDEDGRRLELNYARCHPMVDGDDPDASPVRIGLLRDDVCPHCGGRMVDILRMDCDDGRLGFLGIEGILTATCCPSCVGLLKGAAFSRYTTDGGSEPLPSELFDGSDSIDCYLRPEDYERLSGNRLTLSEEDVPLFYGRVSNDVDTVGGFANWVQDWEYTECPDCGRPMRYLAQIQWCTLIDGMEGTLYIEVCPDCRTVSMQHQQT